VRDVIERHGGTVFVDSHGPPGARFVVRIPVSSGHLVADEYSQEGTDDGYDYGSQDRRPEVLDG
jgi:hypothetical protein